MAEPRTERTGSSSGSRVGHGAHGDRHRAVPRSPLLLPGHPGWRNRKQRFDELAIAIIHQLNSTNDRVADVEFAVEEVPPSDPSPWEPSVALGRSFPGHGRVPGRVVLYRMPIITRARTRPELVHILRNVLVENLSQLLLIPPEDIDPKWSRS